MIEFERQQTNIRANKKIPIISELKNTWLDLILSDQQRHKQIALSPLEQPSLNHARSKRHNLDKIEKKAEPKRCNSCSK